jgi:xylulokinase
MGQQGYTQGAHVVAGQYYVLIGLYTSGASVDWLREILGEIRDLPSLIAEAEQVPPGSLGVCFLPHLRFANPPHDDPKGRGAFIGLSTDAKHDVLFRALLEGLAYEARYSLETLMVYPGMEPLQKIYVTGGSTRNRLLVQLRATILNQPLTMVEVGEATSLGAAILGGLGAGVYADTASIGNTVHYKQITIDPVPDDVPLYNAYFQQVYKNIYASLRELHHKIYRLQQPGR